MRNTGQASRKRRASPDAGEHSLHPNYRPDIDGLRAVAILAVVAFHLSSDVVRRGFLGVDVFFVISGFLISTIIFKNLAYDRFSFLEFYQRRIRRIFPGLVLVIAFCLFVGWHALLPTEFTLLGEHVISSTIFIENFRIWQEAGYFDLSTSLKPLMHLWSLAIEEQFYLIFPLLMWASCRFRLNMLAVVALIFFGSVTFYLYDLDRAPIAAFFSPQSRFWELMAGASLAYLSLHHAEILQRVRALGARRYPTSDAVMRLGGSMTSLIGLVLLGFVLLGLNQRLPLADLTGEVFAVLGSALLIASGPDALVNRLVLSNRIAVFVGLISYPLYLWHWPLLSFLTIIDGNAPPFYQRAIAVAASFVLATLTYRFVELPIRRRKSLQTKTVFALLGASAGLLLLGFSVPLIAPRYDDATQKIIQAWNFRGYPGLGAIENDKDYGLPAIGKNRQHKIMLIGDSHAHQYRQTVQAVFNRFPAVQDRFPEVMFMLGDNGSDMLTPERPIFKKMLGDNTLRAVVFSEFWAFRRTSDKINYSVRCCGNGLLRMVGPDMPKPLPRNQVDEMNRRLEETVILLKRSGKDVSFIPDNPFGEELAPRSLLKRSFFDRIKISVTPLATQTAIERDEPTRSTLEKIARETGARIIDPFQSLCDTYVCPALAANGMPMYKDYDHLSEYALIHEIHYLDWLAWQPE
jgi:peptidoglycan/LPS O-acetylase OafA/YrhL